MNKTFRLVWNEISGACVAVAEHVSARGQRSAGAVALTVTLSGFATLAQAQSPPAANALPEGGRTVAGQASISSSGAAMTIDQSSQRAAIDWQRFDIGSGASVHFNQPTGGVALNRVDGASPSQIFGRLTATGQVFLSNPGGVYFAPGARVDVGGLVATTHRIGLDDFMSGKLRFERQGATGSVINEGELKTALGGYVALLAPEVRNQGVILARMGTVALAAGEAFELQFDGNNTLASLRVEPSTIRALVDNHSAVLAPGGLVILSAQALNRVQGGVIRNSGRIEATGLAQRGGRIVLEASSQIANSGQISANATADGPAGSVRLQAPEVVNSGAITATGSDAHPQGGQIQIVADSVTQTATGVVNASGPVRGGAVQIQATAHAALAGRVAASATLDVPAPAPIAAADPVPAPEQAPTQGGSIHIQAAQITLSSATLDSSGGQGGRILLDASAPAPVVPWSPPPEPVREPGQVALLGSTQLNSRGRRGSGGELKLLGDGIALNDETALDASGSAGGGTVRVGGGWQGGEGLHQATNVSMAAGASIDASATGQGDGGSVVLWSDVTRADGHTQVDGRILARGGAHGGDGGEVETSGHTVAIEGARVNAGADAGTGGLWLIDPYNYTIGAAQAAAIAGNASSGLNSGTSVTVTTTANNTSHGSSGNAGDVGNITVNAVIAKTSGGDATLTLKAHRDIQFNAGSGATSSNGKLHLVLWSRSVDDGQSGTIALNSATLNTNGGHVWMGGGAQAAANWNGLTVGNAAAATWAANTAALRLAGSSITTGGGHFLAGGLGYYSGATRASYSHGAWVSDTSISTGSGNLTLQGEILGNHTTANNVSAGLSVQGSTLSSTSGSVTLQGKAAATGQSDGTVFGTYLTNRSTVQSDSGAINVYGTNTTNAQHSSGIWMGSVSGSGAASGNGASGYSVSVLSNSGNILMDARAQSTRADGWAHAFVIITYGGDRQRVQTVSGNITIKGDANVTKNDASGVQFQANDAAGNIHVISGSGDIYVQGFQQSGSTHAQNNALRFTPGNSVGSIRFGAATDSASYTGRLTFEADSIWNNTNNTTLVGAIKAIGSGAMAFQSSGARSVKDFSLVNLWDFGSAHSSFSIGKPTEDKTITLGASVTAAGPITIQGGNIVLDNHLTSTLAGASIRLLASGSITSGASVGTVVQLDANAGDVLLAADTDGNNNGNIDFTSQTLSIDTRSGQKGSKSTGLTGGGQITLGGGNLLGSGYASGVNNNAAEGIRARDMVLNSGGGDIHLRGRSWSASVSDGNGAWGVGIFRDANNGNLTINSGAGRVRIEGIGRSWGNDSYKQGIAVYGNTDIRSAYAGNDAIQLIGTVTATAANGNNHRVAVDLRGAATLAATGTGGGLSVHGNTTSVAMAMRGTTYLLTQGGDLNLSGTRLANGNRNELFFGTGGNVWLGSAAGQAVTASNSRLKLEFDDFFWAGANGQPNIATTGAVTIQSNAAGFGQGINTNWFNWNRNGQTIGGLTIGKASNTSQNVTLGGTSGGGALVVNGAVTAYGGTVDVSAPLTVTGTGDIYLRAYADGNTSINVNSAIGKTGGGDATLTLRGNGRVNAYSSITASGAGTGKLNLVIWADADGNRLGGAATAVQTFNTNGGHVWIGGGAGTTTWNGLTVGDGASPGAYGANHHGMDLNGNFNTAGGHFYAAGKSYISGGADISPTASGNATTINTGSGDITFVGNRIFFGRSNDTARTTVNTTGTLTIRPWDDSFAEDFNVRGSLSGGHWVGSGTGTGTANLTIQNAASLGGLVIGKATNTSAITVHNSLGIAGNISLYGGRIANAGGASLTSTAGSLLLDADVGSGLNFDGAGILWTGGSLNASSTAAGAGNVRLIGRGGSKTNSSSNHGVSLTGSATINAGGDVDISGTAVAAGTQSGVQIQGGTPTVIAGRSLSVDGTHAGMVASAGNTGLRVEGANLQAGGALTLSGQAGAGSSQAVLLHSAQVQTTGSGGHIAITARQGGTIASSGAGAASLVQAGAGADITLTADRLDLAASRPLVLSSTGTLAIQPWSTSFASPFVWDGALAGGSLSGTDSLANITVHNLTNLGGLTLGKAGNTSGIVIEADTQVAGTIRLHGHDIALNAALIAAGHANAAANRIELHASGRVTQTEALTAHGLGLHGAGRFTLEHAGNDVDLLSAGDSGARVNRVSFVDADGLRIEGIQASGTVQVETLVGDLHLAGPVATTSTASDAVVLNAARARAALDASGGNLTVGAGATVSVGAGGRATLYSGSVAGSTGLADLIGSGSGRFRYASDEVSTGYLSPLGAGAYAIYREQPTVTLKGVDQSVVYGQEAALGVDAAGWQNGDTVAQGLGRQPTVSLAGESRSAAGHLQVARDGGGNVVGYGMSLSRDAVSSLGYALSYDDSGRITVTPKALSAVINDDAKFAGLADNASYAGATFNGFARGESVADIAVGAVITRSSAGEAVGRYAGALTGSVQVAAGNYVLDPAQVTAGDYHIVDHDTLIVRVGSATAVYGDTASYDVSQVRYYDTVTNREVGLTQGSSEFHWTLGGNSAQAVNFALNSAGVNVGIHGITGSVSTPHSLPNTASASQPGQLLAIGGQLTITPRTLSVSANKVYDGSTALDGSQISFGNLFNGETLSVLAAQASDRNVTTANKYVSSLTLGDGSGLASNYQLGSLNGWSAGNTVNITPRALGVSVDKVYDGLASASAAQTTLHNLVAGETLAVLGVGLSDAHVATAGKYVSSLSLADSGPWSLSNYSLPALAGAGAGNSVSITPRLLSARVDAASNTSKVYDGSTATHSGFSATLGLDGTLAGDSATLSWTAAYDDRSIDARRIVLTDLALASINSVAGSQASDYAFDGAVLSVAGNITPRTVSANTVASPSKVYDGTTAATGATVALADAVGNTGKVAGDDLGIVAAGGSFSSANAGTGLSYTLVDITLSGADARNYVLDGGTITGANGVITPRQLTLDATKVYDGSTGFTDALVLGNLVQGEYLLINSASSASARVGGLDGDTTTDDNRIASINLGNVVDGATVIYRTSNYSLPGGTAITSGATQTLVAAAGNTVRITPAVLSVGVNESQVSKVYDGTVAAAGGYTPGYTVTGLVGSDTAATLGQLGMAFNDANVAGANSFTISGIGVSSIAGSQGSVASDYALDHTSITLPGSITARAVEVDVNAGVRKTYDATTGVSGLDLALSNLVAADAGQVSVVASGGGFDSRNAGSGKSYTLTGLSLTGAQAGNYQIASGDSLSGIDGIIDPKRIQVQGLGPVTKVYDGSTDAGAAGQSGSLGTAAPGAGTVGDGQVYTGDDVQLSGVSSSGVFNSKDVATATRVDFTGFSLTGADAANYLLEAASAAGSITQRTVTLSANKVYDGSTDLSGHVSLATGVAGESLGYSGASASDRHVATAGKHISAITLIDGVNGELASNYQLPTLDAANAAVTITPRALSASATITGDTSKVYDGSTAATGAQVSGSAVSGAIAGDDIALETGGIALAYNSKDVATASQIVATGTATLRIDGSTAGSQLSDYSFTAPAVASVAASITPKTVAVTGLQAQDKTYDGLTQATVTDWGSVSTGVGAETLSLSGASAAFDDANAGMGKLVTASGYVLGDGTGGGLASNYQLAAAPVTTMADIHQALLTVIANDDTRFVIGSDAPGYADVRYSGFVNNETSAVLSGSATVSRQNAGTNAAGVYDGVLRADASGLSATNYRFATQDGRYTIEAASQLRVTVQNASSTYGSQAAYGIASAVYVDGAGTEHALGPVTSLGSNRFSVSDGAGGSATFTVVPGSAQLSGAGVLSAGVYTLVFDNLQTTVAQNFGNTVNALGSHTVTPKALIASASGGLSKVYDGTRAMDDLALALAGLETGDAVSVSGSGLFDSRNAGSNVGYTLSGLSLSGDDAGNYSLASSATGSNGSIAQRTVTLSANKVYDGSTDLSGHVSLITGVAGESLGYSGASASDRHVATAGKHISAITLIDGVNGELASNYQLPTLDAANAAVTITPRALTTSATITGSTSKVYDGSTATAALVSSSVGGAIAGDDFELDTSGIALAYDSKDVLAASQILASGAVVLRLNTSNAGSQLSDYSFSTPVVASVAATITPKAVVASASGGISKVYDGTRAMDDLALALAGLEAGDVVAVNGSGLFDSKNVGSNLGYTLSGLTLSGRDAGNYALAGGGSVSGNDGSITPRTLLLSFGAQDKVYDGQTTAGVSTSDDRVAGDLLQVNWASASFADKNVGTAKAVSIGGVSLAGDDAANYTVAASGAASASITRLDTVVWTGGASGDWFDPANWAGGAVPDLSNVAHVIIPAGVEVRFGGTAVAPAQTGPVHIDSLGGAGGGLVQTDGSLHVGAGGVTLGGFDQSGGSLTSQGPVVLDRFNQSGGSTSTGTDFTVTTDFNQGPAGSVHVGGNAHITDTSAGTTVGNLVVDGDLELTSQDGDVTQAPGTALAVGGETTVNAGAHDILLTHPGNRFDGPFNATGDDIHVNSGGVLTLGQIVATGSAAFGGTVVGLPTGQAAGAVFVPPPPPAPAMVLPQPQQAPPELLSAASERVDGGGVSVLWRVQPSERQGGAILVLVPAEIAEQGFSFALPERLTEGVSPQAEGRATLADGAVLPGWLAFVPGTRRFVATAVAADALPLDVVVTLGNRLIRITIAWRS